jgi:hypothetical protein
MVWKVSCHYNHDERLAPLMEQVSNQLVGRVKENITVKSILRKNPEVSAMEVEEARKNIEC